MFVILAESREWFAEAPLLMNRQENQAALYHLEGLDPNTGEYCRKEHLLVFHIFILVLVGVKAFCEFPTLEDASVMTSRNKNLQTHPHLYLGA